MLGSASSARVVGRRTCEPFLGTLGETSCLVITSTQRLQRVKELRLISMLMRTLWEAEKGNEAVRALL